MAKSLRKVSMAILSLALVLAYYVPAKAAMLYDANVTLDNPLAAGSSTMTFQMKAKSPGTVKGVKMQFLRTAAPDSGNPSSMSIAAPANATLPALGGNNKLTADWAIDDTTDLGTDIYYLTKAAGDVLAAGDTISWSVSGVTNPPISADAAGNGCSRRVDPGVPNITDASSTAGTCYVRIVTYGVDSVATMKTEDPSGAAGTFADVLDYTTVAFTVTSEVTMKAVVDASMAFTVAGVNSGTDVTDAGATSVTSETSQYNTLDFKNISVGNPKIMAQKLYVKTNAQGGYSVKVKATTDNSDHGSGNNLDINGVLKGQYTGNNIDGFGTDLGSPANWTTPQTWAAPTSASANTNSGYFGVNSNDAATSTFTAAGGNNLKWSPMMNSAYNTVMYSTGPDLGGEAQSHIVSYAIEVNVYQPADQYTGYFVYQATPTY